MPRQARYISEYMHIITRGIGKQILFEDDPDRKVYLSYLKKSAEETDVKILAYVLMENHVHLLLCSKELNFSEFMQKVGTRYARYYNKKYDRTGYLFQGRYKSEAILGEEYLLTAFRYILNNPAKAGICSPFEYEWSSIKEYGGSKGITDTSIFKDLIGTKQEFKKFMLTQDVTECMEYVPRKRDDKWAMRIIKRELGLKSATEIQKYDRDKRDETLVKLKEMGISIRQLERLTGINRGVIQKAKVVSGTRPR